MKRKINTLFTLLIVTGVTQPLIAEDYPFSRVFTDQSERVQLDRLRSKRVVETESMTQQPVLESRVELTPGDRIIYSGALVSRQMGSASQTSESTSTVSWVDGKSSLSGGQSLPAHQVDPRASHVLSAHFETRGSEVTLKPGQVWLTDQQQILESWEPIPVPVDPDLPSEDPNQSL